MIETMEYLQKNVEDSPTFRTWVGAANAVEARAHIYTTAAPKDASRPMALIELTDDYEEEQIGFGGSGSFHATGSVRLWFDAYTDEEDDGAAIEEFDGVVQDIIEEIRGFSGRPDYLAITRIMLEGGPGLLEIDREEGEDEDEGKRLMQVTYNVGWN